jgi:hypothetical protein
MTRGSLIEDTLEAIEEGRLSMEQVLRRALDAGAGCEPWLRRALTRTRELEPRHPTAREHAGTSPELARAALRAARRRFGRCQGVAGVAWGLVEERRRATGRQGLIVIVQEKLARESLRKSRVLPKTLPVRLGERWIPVPVDVQRLARGVKEQRTAAGHHALVRVAQGTGTLSALVERQGAFLGIISGHLARSSGAVVVAELANGSTTTLGTVGHTREDLEIDGARVDGVSPADAPALTTAFTELRDLDAGAINARLTVRRAQGDGDAHAFVAQIEAPAAFDDESGGRTPMRGLIKLDKKVTRRGDSGAPVLDFQDRLVGFVVGSADGHTYVIPARKVIDALL